MSTSHLRKLGFSACFALAAIPCAAQAPLVPWSTVAATALAVEPGGTVLALTSTGISRLDGSSGALIASAAMPNQNDVTVAPDGTIYVSRWTLGDPLTNDVPPGRIAKLSHSLDTVLTWPAYAKAVAADAESVYVVASGIDPEVDALVAFGPTGEAGALRYYLESGGDIVVVGSDVYVINHGFNKVRGPHSFGDDEPDNPGYLATDGNDLFVTETSEGWRFVRQYRNGVRIAEWKIAFGEGIGPIAATSTTIYVRKDGGIYILDRGPETPVQRMSQGDLRLKWLR